MSRQSWLGLFRPTRLRDHHRQAYMKTLARSLAKENAGTSMTKALAAGLAAALAEELLYRGFIQQKWNLIAGRKQHS